MSLFLKFNENTLSKIVYRINEEDGRSDNTFLYKKEKEINKKLQFSCVMTRIEIKSSYLVVYRKNNQHSLEASGKG